MIVLVKFYISIYLSIYLSTKVLELICSGSVVLEENDISGLVEVSSLLGCIGDMLKEPVVPTHQVREHVKKTLAFSGKTPKNK